MSFQKAETSCLAGRRLRPAGLPSRRRRRRRSSCTAKSLNELADDLGYLVKSVAPDDQRAQAALGGLEQFKAGAIIKGLDQGRGFGLAVTLPKDFPAGSPSVVAAVPVSNLGQFLDSLKNLGVTVDDKPGVAGFSHSVTGPNGSPPLFVLESKGYAIFSLAPEGVDKLGRLRIPASWRTKGSTRRFGLSR